MYTKIFTSAALILAATSVTAAPVDLSSWSVEGGGGRWTVATDNNSVFQSINTSSPTIFFNNSTSSQGNDLRGTIEVQTTSDDDFIGFVLGYNSGDLTNASADYLLVDWKQFNQSFGSLGFGARGLAISRVTGQLGNDSGAWGHNPANNVTELARGTTLGDTGWDDNTSYDFQLNFTSSLVEVFVNGALELSVTGVFQDGGFGFYNYSQQSVRYAGVTTDVIPVDPDPIDPPVAPVPLPASLPLLLAGLGGFAAMRRRKG